MMRTQITLKVKTLSAEGFKFEAATTKVREVLINGVIIPKNGIISGFFWGYSPYL